MATLVAVGEAKFDAVVELALDPATVVGLVIEPEAAVGVTGAPDECCAKQRKNQRRGRDHCEFGHVTEKNEQETRMRTYIHRAVARVPNK